MQKTNCQSYIILYGRVISVAYKRKSHLLYFFFLSCELQLHTQRAGAGARAPARYIYLSPVAGRI